MIVEERCYRLYPGQGPAFLALVEDEGLAIQAPYLGEPLGYFTTESGTLNQVVHLWGFDSASDREAKRAQLAADAAWQAFVPKVLPMIQHMKSRILVPTGFSAIGGKN